MGQKANPNAIRLGITKPWNATWYPSDNKDWAKFLGEDKKIRNYFKPLERKYFIGRIVINRIAKNNKISVDIYTARPGIILGKDGSNIKEINIAIKKVLKDKNKNIELNVKEIPRADLSAQLVANEIAIALENRVPFRIIQKKMIARVMKAGALGVKTKVSGRLNGVEMARSEGYSRGVVPLQTFRNDIDFSIAEAKTTYGVIGVKVWISKSEILGNKPVTMIEEERKPYKKRYNNNRPNNGRSNNNRPNNGGKTNSRDGAK